MFKHPTGDNTVTSITNIDEKMIQPNTIDLRIKSVNVIIFFSYVYNYF